MRFLGYQARDARIVETNSGTTLGSTDQSAPVPRSDGVVYHQDANFSMFTSGNVTIAAGKYRARGIHMLGPNEIADQGGTRTCYRVIANAHCFSDKFHVTVGFGRSPTDPDDTAAGQELTGRVYLAGGKNFLVCDDLIAVDPFPTADEAKAICFYIAFQNPSSASAGSQFECNLSVARLIGPRPMMHDQRIQ